MPERNGISVVDQFVFPKVTFADAHVAYEQYSDADIVETKDVVALQPMVAYDWKQLAITLSVAAISLFALAFAGVWFWRRRSVAHQRPAYNVPAKLTPFSLVAFLRRMAGDQRLSLTAADQESLQATIADLEGRYFSDRNDIGEDTELRNVFDRWNAKAQKSFTQSLESTITG